MTTGLRERDTLVVSILLPLTTFLVLCYEIALTRLFSYVFVYNFTPLAVSFAVFGLGAGAYLRVRWLSSLPQRLVVVVASVAASVALLVLYAVLLLTHQTVVVIAASALPFVCAGVAVSHYYEVRRAERAAVTYALDLAGAAVACAASVFVVAAVGADGALLWLAGLAGAIAAIASTRAEPRIRRAHLIAAALCGVVPLAAYPFRARWPDPLLNRHSSTDKQLPRYLREQGKVVDSAWSGVGRADLFETPNDPDKLIFSDGTDSMVLVVNGATGLRNMFAFMPFAIEPVRSALILGSGAGLEVRMAREAGVAEIEAVELNPAITQLVRRWERFSGPIYDLPGVSLFIDDARKFLLTRQRRYDLIQIALVLTGTTQSRTYALAEGHLYTREAFESYLDHLEPTGVLALIDDSPERTIRNTVTAVAVLERRLGLRTDEAMRHVVVVSNRNDREPGYRYLLMVSAAPLAEARQRRLLDEAAVRAVEYLWLPGVGARSMFQGLATLGTDAFVRAAPVNYAPPTDDKPYLNNFAKSRAQQVDIFRPHLFFSALMLAVLLTVFVFDGRRGGMASRRATALAGLYGAAFMLMELGLLQKLTLSVARPTSVLSVLLFSLLLWCGVGSLLSARLAPVLRPRIGSFAVVVALVGVITTAVAARYYLLAGVSSSWLRLVCVLAMVAPIGLSLGAPFPDLLARYGRSDDRRLAYLWAINGLGAVLGSSLTLVLLPNLGGSAVLLIASALYFVAWTIDRGGPVPVASS